MCAPGLLPRLGPPDESLSASLRIAFVADLFALVTIFGNECSNLRHLAKRLKYNHCRLCPPTAAPRLGSLPKPGWPGVPPRRNSHQFRRRLPANIPWPVRKSWPTRACGHWGREPEPERHSANPATESATRQASPGHALVGFGWYLARTTAAACWPCRGYFAQSLSGRLVLSAQSMKP